LRKFFFILLFYLTVAPVALAEEHPLDLTGRKISSIEFISDVPVQEGEIEYLLTFAEGDYYNPEAINQSLKFIYLRNLFDNIYAVAEPDGPNQVKISLVIVPKTIVDRIEFIGNIALSDDELLGYIKVRLDDELRNDRVAGYIDEIANAYYRSGYTLTKVNGFVEPDNLNHTALLRFFIEEGRETRIAEIGFRGEVKLPDLTLLWEMDSAVGTVLNLNRLDEDIEILRLEYRRRGYYNVKIAKPEITYTRGVELAKIEIEINAGERYEFLVECGQPDCFIREREIDELMKLSELDEVNEIRLREIADKIHEFYLRYGYRHAKVESEISEISDGGKQVRITVDEGQRIYVRSIRFEGNLNLTDKLLLGRMQTHQRSWGSTYGFGYPRVAGVLIDKDIEEDLEQIEKLYQKHGFLSAQAGPVEVVEDALTNELDLVIPISEGRQTRVRNIIVEGNLVFSRETLLQMLGVTEETPVDPWALEDGKRRIKTAYLKRGYYHVEVTIGRPNIHGDRPISSYAGDDTILSDVKIEITEGIQVRVGKIVVRGNVRTYKFIVLRQMTIKEGDLFDQDKITENRKRLYQLGFFSRVYI
jgi:outer membrane protein assembly factor BamA